MIRRLRQSTGVWSQLRLALAMMALVMRVMIPPGFMMGQAPSGAFAMVICSPAGSQAAAADWAGADGRQKAPNGAEKHDSPCVFAGHGLADSPAAPPVLQPAAFGVPAEAPEALPRDVAPGRGLAAPPPPATGPPLRVI